MQQLKHLVAKSAREWHVSLRAAYAIFLAPLITSALLIPLRLDKGAYKFLLDEDRVLEWATFACFVLAAIVGLRIAFSQRQAGKRWAGLLFVLFAGAMVFSAGEEISWGQRVVGFETPGELLEINKQDEFNLHNIGESLSLFKAAMMVIGLIGSVAFVANQRLRIEQYWSDADALLVPPFFLATSFFVVLAYRLFRLFIWTESGFTVTAYGESIEFWLAFAFFVFSVLVWRRQRLAQPERVPAHAAQHAPSSQARARAEDASAQAPCAGPPNPGTMAAEGRDVR